MTASMLVLLVLVNVVSVSVGHEWATSREQHCIERCELKEKLGTQAYACYTVDGIHKEYRPSSEDGRPPIHGPIQALDDDKFPWDFCTPSPIKKLTEEDNEENKEEGNNLQPEETEQNGGGQGWNPGAPAASTSLENVDCSGPCQKEDNGAYMCFNSYSENKAYCSPPFPIHRVQVSSHNKLWCIDQCKSGSSGEHYCRTLFGEDICSRDKGFSTKGTQCESACAIWPESTTTFLTCKIGVGLYEACGSWDIADYEKNTVEFTSEGQVCASPCIENEGEHLCTYAEWRKEGSEEVPKAVLYMMEGFCGPDAGFDWVMVGIIVGAVVGAIIIIALIGICVSKRSDYNRAATRDP